MFRAALLALFTAFYLLSGKFGLSLAFLHQSASPVWPPAGLALAGILILGSWIWPSVLAGAFLVNFLTSGSIPSSAVIAVGNTLEAVIGAYLINRFAGGATALETAFGVCKYVLFSGISNAVSATLGVLGLVAGGLAAPDQLPQIWLTWWLGDFVSFVVFAPFFMIWLSFPLSKITARNLIEAALLAASVVFVGILIFGPWSHRMPITFLGVPLIVWPALRFGQRGAISVSVLFSAIAIYGTLHGFGPFATLATPNVSLLFLQGFIGILTMTALILAAVVSERKRVEEQLRWSLAEKVVLLQEIHHRVKNNLQIISSLLSMQSNGVTDPKVLSLLRESQGRIKSMALVHEKLYGSQDLSKIDMGAYVRSLTGELFRSYQTSGVIGLTPHADGVLLPIGHAIPCGLLINELVTNAFRHAFPQGRSGHVLVHLEEKPAGSFRLVVQDNGVGLPPGYDPASADTLGLRLITALTDQLGGKLQMQRGIGTTFTISFQLDGRHEGRAR